MLGPFLAGSSRGAYLPYPQDRLLRSEPPISSDAGMSGHAGASECSSFA
jgi:hypothetical protein